MVAPNAFKGCLTALEAARAIAEGVKKAAPRARVRMMPLADGGDGLMRVLRARSRGKSVSVRVTGPLGMPRRARYARLPGGEAVIEMAEASGIAGLTNLDPLGATSRGTGELILHALKGGAKTLVIGLGGSATNDGGAGMAAALGARLLDAGGKPLPDGAAALKRLARVDASALRRRLAGVRVVGVSDVRNPLLGRQGSARVYGPQKGATPAMVRILEDALIRYAKVLRRDLGADVARLPGAGAAGGLGAGLSAFLGAELVPGAEWVLGRLGARERLAGAALALTGEGTLDRQSFFGKAPVAFARLAKRMKVPVLFLPGRLDPAALPLLEREFGEDRVCALAEPWEEPKRVMRQAAKRLAKAATRAVRDIGLSAALVVTAAGSAMAFDAVESSGTVTNAEREAQSKRSITAAAAASAADASRSAAVVAESDRYYFLRHEGDNLQRAIDLLESRRTERQIDGAALWRLGRAKVRLAERKIRKADKLDVLREAEAVLTEAVRFSPQDADAHCWLGIAYGRRGELQGMLRSLFLVGPIREEMKKTLALAPGHVGAHHVLGEMARRIPRFAGGSKEEAVSHFEKGLASSPNATMVYPALAETYLELGDKAKARAVLERLLAVTAPDDPAEFPDNVADGKRLLERLK